MSNICFIVTANLVVALSHTTNRLIDLLYSLQASLEQRKSKQIRNKN